MFTEQSLEDANTSSTVSKPKNAFQCSYCQRAYGRLDHLARHVRTHTKERPFKCQSCHKAFGRSDLLKRHGCRHPRTGLESLRNSVGSLRVSRACKPCAAAKIRCDEEKPCRRCMTRDLTCEVAGSPDVFEDADPMQQPGPTLACQSPPTSEDRDESALADMRGSPSATTSRPAENEVACMQNDGSVQLDAGTSFTGGLPDALDIAPLAPVPIDEPAEIVDGYVEYLRTLLFCSPNLDLAVPELPVAKHLETDAFWDQFVTSNDGLNLVDDLTLNLQHDLISTNLTVPPLEAGPDPNAEPQVSKAGAAVYQNSMWNWTPGPGDFGTADQPALALPDEMNEQPLQTVNDSRKRVQPSDRDRILSLLLDGCEQTNVVRIIAGFPNPLLLERLLHIALMHQSEEIAGWIHIPTFEVSGTRTELLIALIAYGAFLTPATALRNFACAIPDLLIHRVQKTWHGDNKTSRDPHLLHAWRLSAFILAWSGSPRKTEIAEGILHPVVNVLRRSGKLCATRYRSITPSPTDSEEVLGEKWMAWVEQENLVRLVHQVFMQDAQWSMVHATNPLIAYSEMQLPMPADKRLWDAKSALEWLTLSQQLAMTHNQSDSIASCIRKLMEQTYFSPGQHSTATQILTLHGIWGLVFDDRKYSHVASIDLHAGQMQSWITRQHNELLSRIIETSGGLGVQNRDDTSPETWPFLEFLSMAVHVPLIHLPCLAGKYGTEQARLSFPVLEKWAHSETGRRGVWHAGQLLRHAQKLPPGSPIHAFMVYQAGLVFWVYGIIIQSQRQRQEAADGHPIGGRQPTYIHLDGHWNHKVQRFISMNQGKPAISKPTAVGKCAIPTTSIAAWDASETILCAAAIMRGRSDIASPSLFIENLYQLMIGLGEAAKAMGLA